MDTNSSFDIQNEINYEITPLGEETNPRSIRNLLKKIFVPNNDGEKLLKAEDAYLRATYGEYTNKKELFHRFLRRIKENIKYRTEQQYTWTFLDITPEVLDYGNEIAAALREYGYQVWFIGKEELETINQDNKVNRSTAFLLITWQKVY